MLLRNANNIISGIISGYDYSSVAITEENWRKGTPGFVKDYNGYYLRLSGFNYSGLFGVNNDSAAATPSNNTPMLLLGSNDADDNYNAHDLERITTLSVSGACGITRNTADGVHRIVLAKTFVNNSAQDVVVKEMGVYAVHTGQRAGSSSSYTAATLVAREKLAEPVTIPANGGVATFTMNITFPVVGDSPS